VNETTTVTQALAAWLTKGERLAKDIGGYQWLIADWMLSGESQFNGRGMGDVYDLAEKATGFKRKTLQEWVYVARHVSMRMEGLSFNHHQIVVALLPDAQKQCLERAVAEKLAVSELRELARWQPRRLELHPADALKPASLLLKFTHTRELETLEILARKAGFISDEENSAVGRLIWKVLGEFVKSRPDFIADAEAEYETPLKEEVA
jgi:hypothetical protein